MQSQPVRLLPLFTRLVAVILALLALLPSLSKAEKLPAESANCSINKPTVTDGPVCVGGKFTVTFDWSCQFAAGTTFQIVLSDNNGAFSFLDTPIQEVTLPAGATSITQSVTLPGYKTAGTFYKIRVVAKADGATLATSPDSQPFVVNPRGFTSAPVVTGTPVCAGGKINVSFAWTCPFPSFPFSTKFNIILSNPSGQFNQFTVLKSFSAPENVFTANQLVDIPANIPTSGQYRIRVSATTTIGDFLAASPDSDPFAINAVKFNGAPTVIGAPACAGGKVNVKFDWNCPFPSGTSFLMMLSDKNGQFGIWDIPAKEIPMPGGNQTTVDHVIDIPANKATGSQYKFQIVAKLGGQTLATSPIGLAFTINAPTYVGAPTVTGAPVCAGGTYNVKGQWTCAFPQGTQLHIYLSDDFGFFYEQTPAAKVVSLSDGALSIDETVNAPNFVFPGSQYKVKLVAKTMSGDVLLASDPSAVFTIQMGNCSNKLTVSPSALSGFSTTQAQPSAIQSLLITKISAQDAFEVGYTLPAGYEASFSANGPFLSDDDAPFTLWSANEPVTKTLYVRLKAGISPATYIGNALIATKVNGTTKFVSVPLNGQVTAAPVINQPPVYNDAFLNRTLTQGPIDLIMPGNSFTDPEGQTLTWSASGLPNGSSLMDYNITGHKITGTASVPGTYNVTITATDPGGLSASGTFTLTIKPVIPGPYVAVNPNSLSGFETTPVAPSALQSLVITKLIPDDVSILSLYFPSGYEASYDPNGPFKDSDNLSSSEWKANVSATKTIYIRLKAGLVPGTYSNELGVMASVNGTLKTVKVPLSGVVKASPGNLGGENLQLLAPDYNCQTGAFTFKTSGGDGSSIEYYAVPGITGWTTNPNQFVDAEMRTAADAPVITLRARQGGKEVTMSWNIRVLCPVEESGPVNNPSPGIESDLQLLAPAYSCETGAFTFKTSGGNGSPVEFKAIGITDWTTNPNQFVDAELRMAPDAPSITLQARQGGKEVSLVWNIRAVCPLDGPKPVDNPNPSGGSLQLLTPDYNCQTGAFTFKTTGGDGSSIIEYRAIGITDWTTNPNQLVDAELRTAADAQPITLRARQGNQEVTLVWDIRSQCPVGAARKAAVAKGEAGFQLNVVAYPNPVVDQVTVEVSGAAGLPTTCRLLSINNEVIGEQRSMDGTGRRFSFDLQGKVGGMYLVQVSVPGQQQVIRLIKQ
ncbi:putative Ig domain-containing protein [Spirosoma soli]|uniref:Ig domain-containing protein n=2 Tax=Spirosoma soli TaxID=1770529 RepID=A0ABW5M795_9BACT